MIATWGALATLVIGQTVIWNVEDPAKDDHGPGTYQYPTRSAYPDGVFDLRRFRVIDDGDHVRFEATFLHPIRPPVEQARRTRAIEIPLDNELYVKHVDIYIRTDGRPGRTHALPGRRVRFHSEEGWHRAVIMTPLPYLLKTTLRDWEGVSDIVVPNDLSAIGRRVTATIAKSELADTDPATWGYAVMVFGALWENRFDFYEPGDVEFAPNALTMMVRSVPDRRRFGGGPMSDYHPNVIDLLAPTRALQYQLLSTSDPRARRYATISLTYPIESPNGS